LGLHDRRGKCTKIGFGIALAALIAGPALAQDYNRNLIECLNELGYIPTQLCSEAASDPGHRTLRMWYPQSEAQFQSSMTVSSEKQISHRSHLPKAAARLPVNDSHEERSGSAPAYHSSYGPAIRSARTSQRYDLRWHGTSATSPARASSPVRVWLKVRNVPIRIIQPRVCRSRVDYHRPNRTGVLVDPGGRCEFHLIPPGWEGHVDCKQRAPGGRRHCSSFQPASHYQPESIPLATISSWQMILTWDRAFMVGRRDEAHTHAPNRSGGRPPPAAGFADSASAARMRSCGELLHARRLVVLCKAG